MVSTLDYDYEDTDSEWQKFPLSGLTNLVCPRKLEVFQRPLKTEKKVLLGSRTEACLEGARAPLRTGQPSLSRFLSSTLLPSLF